jgi:hypothetical protein
MRKVFLSFKQNLFLIKQSENFKDMSLEHHKIVILTKSFNNLKNYGPLSREYMRHKSTQYKAMRSHYLAAIVKHWRQVTIKKMTNQKKSKDVQKLRQKISE